MIIEKFESADCCVGRAICCIHAIAKYKHFLSTYRIGIHFRRLPPRGESAIFVQFVGIHLLFDFSKGRWWSLT